MGGIKRMNFENKTINEMRSITEQYLESNNHSTAGELMVQLNRRKK